MRPKFHGVGVALVTPFKKNLTIDWEGLERMIQHVSDGGVDYLVIQGTTGESATISKSEKKKILAFVKEKNKKQLPIVFGVGGNDTKKVLEEIKDTDFEGVDAILSVCPYYNKPGQKGVTEHFTRIADACPVPIILYNIPGRTGINMNAETVSILANHPNIIGVKEASCVIEQCMEIIRDCPVNFLLISGDDVQATPIISIGGVGVMSVIANAFPKEFSSLINTALDGNFASARTKLSQFLRIDSLLYEEGNPVGVKKILETLGVIKSYVRQPLLPASKDLGKRQTAVLKRDGFI